MRWYDTHPASPLLLQYGFWNCISHFLVCRFTITQWRTRVRKLCPQCKYKHLRWVKVNFPHAHSHSASSNNIIMSSWWVRGSPANALLVNEPKRTKKNISEAETIIVNNPSTQSHRSFSVPNLKFIIVCWNYRRSALSLPFHCRPSLSLALRRCRASQSSFLRSKPPGCEHINCF